MDHPLLLSYNLRPGTAAGVQKICMDQGIRVREVAAAEYGKPIGLLAGIPMPISVLGEQGPAFSDEMLVMCRLSPGQLDAFLKAMRENALPRIPLKAVLTPTNAAWTSVKLRTELAREHEAMQRYSR